MAIWQFRVYFAPTEVIRSRMGGVLPSSISEGIAENPYWSSDIQPFPRFEEWIDATLPRTSSWSEEMEMWGDQEGDFASVCYSDEKKNQVEEITFRLDARNNSHDLVRAICSLARALDCVLITAKNQVLEPKEAIVGEAFQNSTAKKYLEDPVAALLSLQSIEATDIPPRKRDH